MKPGILGKKIGMTRVIGKRGSIEPVTVLKAGPCVVLQVKTEKSDGYDAVQLGFEECKPHRSTVPMIGHAAKAGSGPKRYVREIRLAEPAEVHTMGSHPWHCRRQAGPRLGCNPLHTTGAGV